MTSQAREIAPKIWCLVFLLAPSGGQGYAQIVISLILLSSRYTPLIRNREKQDVDTWLLSQNNQYLGSVLLLQNAFPRGRTKLLKSNIVIVQ